MASDMGDGAAEPGRIAGGEQLLGVGAGGTAAAERARRRDGEIEDPVVTLDATVPPRGRGGSSGVETLLERPGCTHDGYSIALQWFSG